MIRRSIFVGVLLLAATAVLGGDAVLAQGPEKARKTSDTETFSGEIVQLRGKSIPGAESDEVVPIYVQKGEELKRFAISINGTPEAPRTIATHNGEPVTGDALRSALNSPGRPVTVTYRTEPYMDTEAHLATRIELGDVLQSGSPAPGLRYEDLSVGEGKVAEKGDRVMVHYTGWLQDGTKFDSSRDRGRPMVFPLGAGRVIKGWDLGIPGMREGGKRKLTVGPSLGYGMRGIGPIPPNATLVFEVELIKVD